MEDKEVEIAGKKYDSGKEEELLVALALRYNHVERIVVLI